MATLGLGLAGYAVGGPLGGIVGSLAGALIDRTLAGTKTTEVRNEGPRLENLNLMIASEGSPILRIYGRMRVDTQLIWATRFREVATSASESSGGGGKGVGSSPAQETVTTTTTYSYFVSFALGLCEGPIVDIGAIWADGKPLDMSGLNWRLYRGDETQGPDPKIAAVEGADRVPGFRGLAYLVFDEIPIAQFGNRIPQITVEVIRRPGGDGPRLEDMLTGVTMIPALGEFAYATDSLYATHLGQSSALNRHGKAGKADLLLALDQLQSAAPAMTTVSLAIGWLGTDLRCGSCQIQPRVEVASKSTTPWSWQAGGISRNAAEVVSSDGLGALLGGAPADRSVVQAITELKARGLRVLLHPFVMMDTPSGNAVPNPYSDHAAQIGQPAFPWRGRITCSPARGFAGTVDKTAAAATQINAFFGTATSAHFGAWNGDTIPYVGPAEWSYRRMALHLAKLAVAAGGVDAMLIGSELIGLTSVRSSPSTFPAIAKLVALADDVKAIVGGGCKVGYAADWTEYASFRPDDGSGDVYFNLDPLWSSGSIDFVGIDNYLPLSDWRAGHLHLDAEEASSIYDQAYLKRNVEGGELFDWYYASPADRKAQRRTPITDTAYGEPWVFRYKDIRSWWSNTHHDRPAGVRNAGPTGWSPQSKPIWFTEFGCPAIDKGTNQPNVFYDPKSSESFLPYFSTGRRDDLVQRSYLEAMLAYWNPAAGNNPVSALYGAPMVSPDRMYAWTWDARPYPQFPSNSLAWRDAANWRRGHWLTGRLGLAPLADVVADISSGLGVAIDVSGLNGVVRGYTLDRIMSSRAALSALMTVYFFDAVESGEAIRFVHRGAAIAADFSADQLVDNRSAGQQDVSGLYSLTRAQETDLPRTAHLRFIDPESDYQVADVYARRQRGSSQRAIEVTTAIVLDAAEAQGIVETLLIDAWVMRETAQLALPPSAFALEPTDVMALNINGRTLQVRIDQLGYQQFRTAQLTRTDVATYVAADGAVRSRPSASSSEPGPAVLKFMDLPLLTSSDVAGVPRLAAFAEPWARVCVYRSPASTGYALDQLVVNPSVIGQTVSDFYSGPLWRWDRVNALYVEIPDATSLVSRDEIQVLAGANSCAVQNSDGEWEVLQFAAAELLAPGHYRLTDLLRGQLGSEYAMRDAVAAGASFVLLDETVKPSTISAAQRHNPWNWKWGPSTAAIDDPTYQLAAFSFEGVGLRPYAPAQLGGTLLTATHDWALRWCRRTRLDGDNWEAPDVPLGEEIESYDVEILSPGTGVVVRTATVSSPAFTYSAAMQTTDFGAVQAMLRFQVYQNSLAYGRGSAAMAETSGDRRR